MATLQTYINTLEPILKDRFSSKVWVSLANEILENLSSERIMKELTYTRGVVVKYLQWITPPSNYRSAIKLFRYGDENSNFNFQETDGKIFLTDDKIGNPLEENTVFTSFTAKDNESITVNCEIVYEENQLAGNLLLIDYGTLKGTTIQIAGNNASSNSTTKIYFLHDFTSSFVSDETTRIELISPDNYLLLRYKGSFEDLTSVNDEIPIKNDYEKRIMRTGLMKYGYERLYGPGSNLEKEWSAKFELLLMKLRQELLSAGSHNRPAGRLWAGFKSGFNFSNTTEDENNE